MENKKHISQEELERIEQYILGQMSTQEKVDFEKDLELSEEKKQNYLMVKSLISGIEEGAFREQLDMIHHEMDDKPEKEVIIKRIYPNWWAIAAAIALAIAAVVWVFFPQQTSHQNLFAQYYQEDPGLITAMSSESQYDFDRAMVDYKSGNYREAIRRWEGLSGQKPDNDTLSYFLGSAHLALAETDLAINYFEKVRSMPTGRFTDDNFWYLALAYLKEGRLEEAKASLEKTEHPLKDDLLQSLRKK